MRVALETRDEHHCRRRNLRGGRPCTSTPRQPSAGEYHLAILPRADRKKALSHGTADLLLAGCCPGKGVPVASTDHMFFGTKPPRSMIQ